MKLYKKLLYGCIRNNIINYSDFELVVAECTHIMNRRPIGFRDALRDTSTRDTIPNCVTPEMIVFGRELISVNILPMDNETDWKPPGSPIALFQNLAKLRHSLYRTYEREFLSTLISQSTDLPNRYKPKLYKTVNVGDIVLIKENYIKR